MSVTQVNIAFTAIFPCATLSLKMFFDSWAKQRYKPFSASVIARDFCKNSFLSLSVAVRQVSNRQNSYTPSGTSMVEKRKRRHLTWWFFFLFFFFLSFFVFTVGKNAHSKQENFVEQLPRLLHVPGRFVSRDFCLARRNPCLSNYRHRGEQSGPSIHTVRHFNRGARVIIPRAK